MTQQTQVCMFHIKNTGARWLTERCVEWLQPASSSAVEICLSKYRTPVHSYVTWVIWVQAGWDRRGQALSTCLWRYTFRQLRARAHHPCGWPGWCCLQPTQKKEVRKLELSAQWSCFWPSRVMLARWGLMCIQHSLGQHQTFSRLIWLFGWYEIRNQDVKELESMHCWPKRCIITDNNTLHY